MAMTFQSVAQTIPEVLSESVQRHGNKTAIMDGDRELSFSDLDRLSNRLAKHLLQMGIRKGDIVAIQLPNSWRFVVSHLAISRIGAVLLPLSLTYRRKELNFMFRHSEAKAVIVVDRWKGFPLTAMMNDLKEKISNLQHVIVDGEKTSVSDFRLSDFLSDDPVRVSAGTVEKNVPSLDDTVAIMFTSGTESDPKAVLHSYRTFVPGHILTGREYQVSSEEVILALTPLCHMFALPIITTALKNGARQVMLDRYQPEKVIQLLEEKEVTFLIAAPTQLIDLLALIKDQRAVPSNLRMVLTGGNKIPAKMVEDFNRRFGCVIAAQWGMTENGAATYTRPDDPLKLAVETVGRVCPTGEIQIFSENGTMLPNGEVGQIGFRGESRFLEYYKNSEATKEAITEEGYFLTGDLGWIDEKGYLHFMGRQKDIINRGGLKVHTAEIEEVLMMHPKIRQVAVVSVEDDRLGEKGLAFVSLRDESDLTLDEMTKFLLDKGMAKYKIPEYLEIRDELPTTASGKIKKGVLRQEVRQSRDHQSISSEY